MRELHRGLRVDCMSAQAADEYVPSPPVFKSGGMKPGYFNGARGYEPRAPLPFSVYLILCIGIGFNDKWINRFQGIIYGWTTTRDWR